MIYVKLDDLQYSNILTSFSVIITWFEEKFKITPPKDIFTEQFSHTRKTYIKLFFKNYDK